MAFRSQNETLKPQKKRTNKGIVCLEGISVRPSELSYLQRSHPKLLATPPLSDLGQIVYKTLKNISSVQVAVVVYVDVDHTLGV